MGHKKVERIDPLTQKMTCGGVDSHAHLDDEAFDNDRSAVIARARSVGLSYIINIFLDPLEFDNKKKMFANDSDIYFVLGVHPCDGLKCDSATLAALEKAFASDARLKAIGEIGLDYHWQDCPKEIQLEIFAKQLDVALKLQKPVVIHCREAEGDCLMVLESRGFSHKKVLWHCFGGNVELVKRLIHHDWYISVPGPITYKANSELSEAVSKIPLNRLLFETDCPYLAPHPWRGTRNEPAYTVFTVQALSSAVGVSAQNLWQLCGQNACDFFDLPPITCD